VLEGTVTEVFEDYCLVDSHIYLPGTLIPKVDYFLSLGYVISEFLYFRPYKGYPLPRYSKISWSNMKYKDF